MCLRRAPEKYITGAALDRAVLEVHIDLKTVCMYERKFKRLFGVK
jgi:hypothetical protein